MGAAGIGRGLCPSRSADPARRLCGVGGRGQAGWSPRGDDDLVRTTWLMSKRLRPSLSGQWHRTAIRYRLGPRHGFAAALPCPAAHAESLPGARLAEGIGEIVGSGKRAGGVM